jgi:hypothetical protein
MAAADTIQKLLEAVFSVRPVPRLYDEGQLPLVLSVETTVRRVGGWCEIAASLGVSELEDSCGSVVVSCCC